LWVNWLHYGMLAILSLTIVATLTAVGLILAIGLLIAPGAIAFLLVRTFAQMLWVSVAVCMGSMLVGTYASFFLDSAPAPTIVLVMTIVFIAAFVRRQLATRSASLQRVSDAIVENDGNA
jgi:manganese/iron transport system permease protein